MSPTAGTAFEAFVNLIARLRGPEGCPWDREQTHDSLKSTTLEEAYEVVEAIDQGDQELVGELGDLLLQVVFHAQIAAEARRFTMKDVIDGVSKKMVKRHPHVFGTDPATTSSEVLRNWEAMKSTERNTQGTPGLSMMDSVSKSLPGVMEAFQITTKASRVGFDWPKVEGVFDKVEEELRELRTAAPLGPPKVTEEVGDLLFAIVNLSRALGVDPESALKAANRKFRRRFLHIEENLRKKGAEPATATLEEMDASWNEAKKLGL